MIYLARGQLDKKEKKLEGLLIVVVYLFEVN